MGLLQKRIADIVWESNPQKAGYIDKIANLVEEIKKDLLEDACTVKTSFIGQDLLGIDKEKFERWFGEDE